MYFINIFINSLIHDVLYRTNFSISEDAHVILTQSEHGLYAYVCIIPVCWASELILLTIS